MHFDFDAAVITSALFKTAQIFIINVFLSADNAIVIALACRGLPVREARIATLMGILGAVILRIGMGGIALFLMQTMFLHIVAGLVLLALAVKLARGRNDHVASDGVQAAPKGAGEGEGVNRARLFGAVWAIVVADLTMSFDNVIAVAAVARDSFFYLAFGLLMSVPMLVWGSALIKKIIDRRPFLIVVAGAFLGWLAGSIAVADPLVEGFIDAHAAFLHYLVPAACAIFVVWRSLSGSGKKAAM